MHGMMDKLINSSGEMEDDLHEKRIMGQYKSWIRNYNNKISLSVGIQYNRGYW
jgi:hypothetical protein